ncbi:MAG: sodium:proton antiporter [Planctomycetota bacterium]
MEPLHLLVLILVVAVGAQWLAARLHLPALLLLLAIGVLLGPIVGVLRPEAVVGADLLTPLVQLAVAVILFEGGLSLHFREARHVGSTLGRLILSGLIVGFGSVTILAILVAGLSPPTAAVLGAILVVTGPTVIIPMLRGARISFRPAALLKWEGIVNDPLGALLAILVLQLTLAFEGQSGGALTLVMNFVGNAGLGFALGSVVGWGLGRALESNQIREDLKVPVILASVLGVFAGAELIQHENGLLAVTAMGLLLGNSGTSSLEDIRHFKEQVSTVLVGVLFIVLSAQLDLDSLRELLGAPLVLVLLILVVARPLVALVATAGTELPWNERLLIGWIAPRGIVAAAVAGAFQPRLIEAGYEDARLLVPIVFGVIAASVVLHGLSIRPLARRLDLAGKAGNGILLVGASTWMVGLARSLARAGAFVVLADTRYRRVSLARQAGLEVHFGDVLSEETELEMPLERVSWLLAGTADDSYNALVSVHFAREFGRQNVLQLTPVAAVGSVRGREVAAHMSGVTPWGQNASYGAIARRFWQGGSFKMTQTTEQFGIEVLREQNPDALFMFYLHQSRIHVMTAESSPPMGAKVVYLASANESAPAAQPAAVAE